MNGPKSSEGAPRGVRLWLRRADQATVAMLVTCGVAALITSWIVRGGLAGRLVDVDAAPRTRFTWQVDVNTAGWAELTVLPDVGDELAKRIVAERERGGPFAGPADLRRVPGIGPKTLARIVPWLAPPEDGASSPAPAGATVDGVRGPAERPSSSTSRR